MLHVLLIAPIGLPLGSHLRYGGTERIVHSLACSLGPLDVRVTVAATGDSRLLGGSLIYRHAKSLWSLQGAERHTIEDGDQREEHFRFALDYALRNDVDVIHDHAGLLLSDTFDQRKHRFPIPIVSTLHGNPHPAQVPRYRALRSLPAGTRPALVAISRSQQRLFEEAGVQIHRVIYHGIDISEFPLVSAKRDYLFWIGRICAEKGTDLAIRLARASRSPLVIAGEVHTPNKAFFQREVNPYLTRIVPEAEQDACIDGIIYGNAQIAAGDILFVGSIDSRQKATLYGNARALVMLNRWDEPFGMVMPEAMATGTPVIGVRRGSIPEIVTPRTGVVLDSQPDDELVADAADALVRLQADPLACRQHVAQRFTTARMAQEYLALYKDYGTAQDDEEWHFALQRGTAAFPEKLRER